MNQQGDNNSNETRPNDAGALQDLSIPTLTEAEADYAEEIKGGIKKATLTVRKSGGDQQEY